MSVRLRDRRRLVLRRGVLRLPPLLPPDAPVAAVAGGRVDADTEIELQDVASSESLDAFLITCRIARRRSGERNVSRGNLGETAASMGKRSLGAGQGTSNLLPMGSYRAATDQKVGGSSPSERATPEQPVLLVGPR